MLLANQTAGGARIAVCWLLALLICSCGEQRSRGTCALIGGLAGAGIGAGAVIASVNESAPDTSQLPFPATQRKDHRLADWDLYGGLAAGIAGAMLGAVAGYYLCAVFQEKHPDTIEAFQSKPSGASDERP
jgi:hypothetical protein